MAVTQIVSLVDGKETLKRSLQRFSTEKIVFVTTKERIKDALSIRNEFALAYKMPTEVKILENNPAKIINELKGQKNAVLNIIDHDDLNYYLISASFILGIPVYFSNGHEMQQLPGPTSKLKDTLSPDQIRILNNLKEEATHEQLAALAKLDNDLLFFYLYGKNSQIGLIRLGLVDDYGERLRLTEFGRLVVGS
jgi:hypothetical protein